MDGSYSGLASSHQARAAPAKLASRFRWSLEVDRWFAQLRHDLALWYQGGENEEFSQQLRSEQFREIRRRLPSNAIGNVLCSLLVVIAVWNQHDSLLLLTWISAIATIALLALRRWHLLQGRDSNKPVRIGSLRKATLASCILGALWGTAVLYLAMDGVQGGELVAMLVVAGMAAGAAVGLASLPQSSIAFVLSSLLPCSLGFAINATVPYIVMAIATLVYAGYLTHNSLATYRTIIRLLRARVHQDRLSAALINSQKMAEEAYREIEEDLLTARRGQLRVMPKPDQLAAVYEKSGVRVEGHFEPCMHLGGDHWSIICPERHIVRFCVSDVAGHGIAAALNSFQLVALLARMTEAVLKPSERAHRLNRDLCRVMETGHYATVLLGELNIDSSELTYVGCGGPAPMLFSPNEQTVVDLDTAGLPMGISTSANYAERTVTVRPGQLLLVFSDALTEALDDDDHPIGRSWIADTAKAHISAHGVAGIVGALVDEFRQRSRARLADDLTIVAMWYDPDEG